MLSLICLITMVFFPVEKLYYSMGYENICIFCSCDDGITIPDKCYPICGSCAATKQPIAKTLFFFLCSYDYLFFFKLLFLITIIFFFVVHCLGTLACSVSSGRKSEQANGAANRLH